MKDLEELHNDVIAASTRVFIAIEKTLNDRNPEGSLNKELVRKALIAQNEWRHSVELYNAVNEMKIATSIA